MPMIKPGRCGGYSYSGQVPHGANLPVEARTVIVDSIEKASIELNGRFGTNFEAL